jgi:hypothetical protein
MRRQAASSPTEEPAEGVRILKGTQDSQLKTYADSFTGSEALLYAEASAGT